MSEPRNVPATPRSPFTPPPPLPSTRTGGPGKPLVIGCLVLLVLAGIGLIGGLYYAGQNYDKLFSWSLARIRDGVRLRLPKDLPADDRERLDAAFTAAQGAASAARRDPAKTAQLQTLMLDLAHEAQGTGTLTRKQVEEITATLEKIGELGKGGPAAAPAPR
jgi:hypothetical protein